MVPSFNEIAIESPDGIREILGQCAQTPQSPTWHPEGDVLKHIRIVYERARATGDINLALAAFFHDLGKAATTKPNNKGGWSSFGHEYVSGRILMQNADWVVKMGGDLNLIKEIVINHMKVKLMDEMRPVKQKQLRENPHFDLILTFSQFDNMKTLTPEELSL